MTKYYFQEIARRSIPGKINNAKIFPLALLYTVFSLGLGTQKDEIWEGWLAALSKAQNQIKT